MKVKSSSEVKYSSGNIDKNLHSRLSDDEIISNAIDIIESRLQEPGVLYSSSEEVSKFLRLKMSHMKNECFSVMFLCNSNRFLSYKEMFHGTVNGASVYVRPIIQEALRLNAGAIILAHNHPSGFTEPSMADIKITTKIKESMHLFDIRVLDHIIIAGAIDLASPRAYSFAENCLL